jgi:cytochrome c-type biogenesis protein
MLGSDPISYAVAFTAGFVSFASPCVLPLVPAYLSFLSGVAFDETRERRWAVFIPTALFVAGFSLAFTILGASVGLFGTLLLEERRTLEVVGGAFLIAMGLLLLGRGIPMFLMRERRFHLRNRPATLVGSMLAGIAFAIGWTPCIGPTLGAALTLAAGSGSWVLGASLLLVYSLGMGIPFLLTGLFWHQATAAMGFLKRNLTLITRVGAAMMVVFGVLVLTGAMTRISAELQGFGPGLM